MPAMWVLGLVWTIGVFLAAIADFLLCMSKRDITITPRAPATLYIGASDEVHFDLTFSEVPNIMNIKPVKKQFQIAFTTIDAMC